MLTIRFDPAGKSLDDRIKIDAPYDRVAQFIASDIQASVHGATHYAKLLREVVTGSRAPIEFETGNAWTMDADPQWTTLSNSYGHRPTSVRLPTSWLVDAIERWRQHLIDQGYPLNQ